MVNLKSASVNNNYNLYKMQKAGIEGLGKSRLGSLLTNCSNKIVQQISEVFGLDMCYQAKIVACAIQKPFYWIASISFIQLTLNTILPINPINNQRQFTLIPKSFEKWLGDTVFGPIALRKKSISYELLTNTQESISQKVDSVAKKIINRNQNLLNSKEQSTNQFNYRATTVTSSKNNAFAVPGGQIVVYSGLIRQLHGAIQTQKFTETTIIKPDGEKVKISLKDVTLEDAAAALIGHEFTHCAARHAVIRLTIYKLVKYVLYFGIYFSIKALINENKKTKKEFLNLTGESRLEAKEKKIRERSDEIATYISALFNLFLSRKNEYEADITGTYLAYQAGFNPLGALYLQQLLLDMEKNNGSLWYHENLPLLYTHPFGEKRKLAIYSAIQALQQ